MPIFNKLIYDWTEYSLWWWANIWEPLNLTVTASGTDATITWEDNEIWTIPPTTFARSVLVRKVGSAPTSPSDWTLVVTETVKDTYKTTWYVDQWLTGWETYYYRVFSYSDLGGISYCDAESVTVSAWWDMSKWTAVQELSISTYFSNGWCWWCAFNPDWTKLYLSWLLPWQAPVKQFSLSTAYDLSSTITLEETENLDAQDIFFKPDWTKLYISRPSSIIEFTLTTPWDISNYSQTWSLSTGLSNTRACVISPDWLTVLVGSPTNWIKKFTLSTAWNLSTATAVGTVTTLKPVWLWMKPDWTMIFAQSWEWANKLSYATLSTPRDITTIWTISQVDFYNTDGWLWLWFNDSWTIALWIWWWSNTNYVTKYTM